MREIKFRAWDKIDCFMYCNVHGGIVFDDGSHYLFDNFLGNQESDDYHEWELMQFTGLRDKNGAEIYEGDILVSELYPFHSEGLCNYRGEVSWFKEDACWSVEMHVVSDRVRGAACGGMLSEYADACEVIGNIHENPELLEG